MARKENILKINAAGPFFVDSSCINCGSCWHIDPDHFGQANNSSFVHTQPCGQKGIERALLALIDCPVAAIGAPKVITSALPSKAFPLLVAKHREGDIYYCGWSSKLSFGASSWLILKHEGNVLIDSPRWSAPLARQISKMGGISQIVLTHRDDVADHARWSKAFNAERWIHEDDSQAAPDVEKQLKGLDVVSLGNHIQLIPTPGHTKGSIVAVFGGKRQILFSGDHLWWNPLKEALVASKDFCWWDWSEQLKSVERLQKLDISWLLPGHGHAHQFAPGQWKEYVMQILNCSQSR